jgi:Gpi18-like mannosyltransferase
VPGLDLWVIYRIEKLRLGGIIYSVNFTLGVIGIYFTTPDFDTSSLISIVVSIVFAYFVYRWSKEWNAKYGNNAKKLF